MSTKFDELTKAMSQSVTRRAAPKKFGIGLAGMALACFGLPNKVQAGHSCALSGGLCTKNNDCCTGYCRPDHTCGCLSNSGCRKEGKTAVCYPDGYCYQWV